MDEPLNLVLFSGTDDKLQAAAVLTAGAAALGKPVNVFLQYWALDAFRADRIDARPRPGPRGRRRQGAPRSTTSRAAGQASWAETLRQAKELGGVDIQACSLSMDLLHLEPDRPRPARRRRRRRDRLLPQRRRGPGRLHLAAERRPAMTARRSPSRSMLAGCPARCRSSRPPRRSRPSPSGGLIEVARDRSRVRQGLRGVVAHDRQRARRADRRTAASTASSCAGSEVISHDHRPPSTAPSTARPIRSPRRSRTSTACPSPTAETGVEPQRQDQGARHRQLVAATSTRSGRS